MTNFAKKLRKPFFLIFSLVFSLSVFSQSLEETRAYADSLLQTGQAESASIAYQRVLFFSSLAQKPAIYFQMGLAAQSQGKWEIAKQHFSSILAFPVSDSLKIEAFFECNLCSILNKEYFPAFIELEKIHFPKDSKNEKRRLLFQATCQYGLGQYEQAQRLYVELVKDDANARKELQEIFNQRKFEQPSVALAILFSFLLPGSGQVYAGDWRQGLNSLGINAVLWSAFVVVIVNVSVLDAFVSVFLWAWRFFYGGCLNAKDIAEKKLLENKDRQYQLILSAINQYKKVHSYN